MCVVVPTLLAIAGVATGVAGLGVQMYGQKKQTEALKRGEDARRAQLTLDSVRKRREIVRNMIMARSNAEFAAAGQGAAFGSALPGATGGVSGQAGTQLTGVNQNEQLGGAIFSANKDYYAASGITGLGQGLSSVGNFFMENAGKIPRVAQNINNL